MQSIADLEMVDWSIVVTRTRSMIRWRVGCRDILPLLLREPLVHIDLS
jgi:hypothetical protein